MYVIHEEHCPADDVEYDGEPCNCEHAKLAENKHLVKKYNELRDVERNFEKLVAKMTQPKSS
jgi:hypothetical protein